MSATGAERIVAERQRHTDVEGWTPEHDAAQVNGELALAAVSYALPDRNRAHWLTALGQRLCPLFWPWRPEFWKPAPDDRIRELEKAGALCAAEIDRLLAAEGATP